MLVVVAPSVRIGGRGGGTKACMENCAVPPGGGSVIVLAPPAKVGTLPTMEDAETPPVLEKLLLAALRNEFMTVVTSPPAGPTFPVVFPLPPLESEPVEIVAVLA
jgi:hypothetical protein